MPCSKSRGWISILRARTSPAIVLPLCRDGSVGKMDPRGLFSLCLYPLVVLSYPRFLLLQDDRDCYQAKRD